jgi:predicted nucleic acid-binding protein
MSAPDRFFDTNVLLYLLSSDTGRADKAEELVSEGGRISVQVLNEFASIATRKLGMSHTEVREVLASIRAPCTVEALTVEIHDLGLQLAERYLLSIYDATIVASALSSGCRTLLSEDMQAGQIIEGKLRIDNPFTGRT